MNPRPVIPVAHDFVCPWCWVGWHQAKQMQEEFGVEIEWRGYELFPEWMAFPSSAPAKPDSVKSDRPVTPTKMQLAYAAQGMNPPTNKFKGDIRTHKAHELVELAKTVNKADAMVERLYRALWEEGKNIDDADVLVAEAAAVGLNEADARAVIEEFPFKNNIVEYDDDAYATGVYNVPTFFIGGERYAEQPYRVLRPALAQAIQAPEYA